MPTNDEATNLTFYRGNTVTKKFVCRDVAGLPYNLFGFTIRSQARLTPNASATLFDITIADGVNGSSFVDGVVVLRVLPSATQSLPPQSVYDITATSGSLTITIARGKINTIEDVTR